MYVFGCHENIHVDSYFSILVDSFLLHCLFFNFPNDTYWLFLCVHLFCSIGVFGAKAWQQYLHLDCILCMLLIECFINTVLDRNDNLLMGFHFQTHWLYSDGFSH